MLKSQQYSKIVFDHVQDIAKNEEKNKDKDLNARKYKSLCKRAGGIFRTIGLIQFLTFIAAKGRKYEHYRFLSEHLQKELHDIGLVRSAPGQDFLNELQQLDLPNFMRVSQSVLKLLLWHKRIGEILIEGDADDPDDKD